MLTDAQKNEIERDTRALGGGPLAVRLNIEKAERDGIYLRADLVTQTVADANARVASLGRKKNYS
jgi:hypothetical protein